MSRIKAGAYGRISRGSNHASIQAMLLRQHLQSPLCSAHCHVYSVQVHDTCMLLFKSCLCVVARFKKIGFYSSHASIQVMLLYSTLQYLLCKQCCWRFLCISFCSCTATPLKSSNNCVCGCVCMHVCTCMCLFVHV